MSRRKRDIGELIQELVEAQAKARREIALLEKEPSLDRRGAFNLQVMRLAVMVGDKIIRDAPLVAAAERSREKARAKGRSKQEAPKGARKRSRGASS